MWMYVVPGRHSLLTMSSIDIACGTLLREKTYLAVLRHELHQQEKRERDDEMSVKRTAHTDDPLGQTPLALVASCEFFGGLPCTGDAYQRGQTLASASTLPLLPFPLRIYVIRRRG